MVKEVKKLGKIQNQTWTRDGEESLAHSKIQKGATERFCDAYIVPLFISHVIKERCGANSHADAKTDALRRHGGDARAARNHHCAGRLRAPPKRTRRRLVLASQLSTALLAARHNAAAVCCVQLATARRALTQWHAAGNKEFERLFNERILDFTLYTVTVKLKKNPK